MTLKHLGYYTPESALFIKGKRGQSIVIVEPATITKRNRTFTLKNKVEVLAKT